MKKVIIIGVLALLAAMASSSGASAGSWIPGSPTYAGELDASDLLENVVDTAYCSGIKRFGKRGEFPYEEFVVFDCSWSLDDTYCSDVRYKAVKSSRRGYFKLRQLRAGDCF